MPFALGMQLKVRFSTHFTPCIQIHMWSFLHSLSLWKHCGIQKNVRQIFKSTGILTNRSEFVLSVHSEPMMYSISMAPKTFSVCFFENTAQRCSGRRPNKSYSVETSVLPVDGLSTPSRLTCTFHRYPRGDKISNSLCPRLEKFMGPLIWWTPSRRNIQIHRCTCSILEALSREALSTYSLCLLSRASQGLTSSAFQCSQISLSVFM